jgi:arylsulfatase A-like enzyme
MKLKRRDYIKAGGVAAGAVALNGMAASGKTSRRPNILYIFSDQQHWQAVGHMDPWFDTPHQDQLAAESVVFENAYCTTPQCSASRSSMLTGYYPHKTQVMANVGHTGGRFLTMPTLGSYLQKDGYQTLYFGKWHLGSKPEPRKGWNQFDDTLRPEHIKTDSADRFFSSRKTADAPFFMVLSYDDPHDIYKFKAGETGMPTDGVKLPKSYHEEDFANKPPIQEQFMRDNQGVRLYDHPEKDWQEYHAFYKDRTKLYDTEVGRVIASLKKNGLYEDTIIIVASDHGDMDTHHKLMYKGPFMYDQMVRVPFMVRVPEVFGGTPARRETAFETVNVDLFPTVCEFAGVELPPRDGLSLKPMLTGQGGQQNRDFVVTQYYGKQYWVNPARMIRKGDYKLIKWIDHGDELYNMSKDPDELINLAGTGPTADVQAELTGLLNQWIEENKDPFQTLETVSHAEGKRIGLEKKKNKSMAAKS